MKNNKSLVTIALVIICVFAVHSCFTGPPSLAHAQGYASAVTPTTIADFTGDGAAHAFASSGAALWVEVCAITANTGTVRIGDSNVTASRGIPLPPGTCQMLPPIAGVLDLYALNQWYYFAASGDKVSVSYVH